MEEKKPKLPTLEKFMEQMYGVKTEKQTYTPEEKEQRRAHMEKCAREMDARREKEKSKHGPENT